MNTRYILLYLRDGQNKPLVETAQILRRHLSDAPRCDASQLKAVVVKFLDAFLNLEAADFGIQYDSRLVLGHLSSHLRVVLTDTLEDLVHDGSGVAVDRELNSVMRF